MYYSVLKCYSLLHTCQAWGEGNNSRLNITMAITAGACIITWEKKCVYMYFHNSSCPTTQIHNCISQVYRYTELHRYSQVYIDIQVFTQVFTGVHSHKKSNARRPTRELTYHVAVITRHTTPLSQH